MTDSPGPCVKASTHSPIHPFFYLSSYLLSHPSIAPSAHISTQRLPFFYLQYPSTSFSFHSLLFFFSVCHLGTLSNKLASLILSFSLIICSFGRVTDQANRVCAQGPLTTGTLASVHLKVMPLVVRGWLVQRWISQLLAVLCSMCAFENLREKAIPAHNMKWAVLKLLMDEWISQEAENESGTIFVID